eukprot:9986-Heterococcus_DN1.PRE.3
MIRHSSSAAQSVYDCELAAITSTAAAAAINSTAVMHRSVCLAQHSNHAPLMQNKKHVMNGLDIAASDSPPNWLHCGLFAQQLDVCP